jgi:hypothetical protein
VKTYILPALLSASVTLSACDTAESPSETYASRLQTAEQLPVSKNISLTAAGKRLPLQTATQTRISFAQNELNEANPPMTQADCTLTSSAFSGALRVPGKVNLPSFGRATPPMTIACTDGKKTVTQTVEVTNLTKLKAQENAAAQVLWGGGLLGAAVLAGMSSERDKSLDLYGYPPKIQVK